MFSFQGVEIERFRGVLISGGWNRGFRGPHFRGLECSEVSSFQGVGIEVSSFQGVGMFRGVLISGGGNRGVLISGG